MYDDTPTPTGLDLVAGGGVLATGAGLNLPLLGVIIGALLVTALVVTIRLAISRSRS